MSMVTTILLEICYRNFYIACVFILMQCFSYFTQGFQLEYFSGLFVTNVQAVDFNFYSDIKHNYKQNHQTEQQLSGAAINCHQHEDLSVYRDKMDNHCSDQFVAYDYQLSADHFIALSSNEAKTWSCLFIVYLNYFYCIQLNQTALNSLLLYTKLEYLAVFIIIHYYSNVKPGLFNKQKFRFFQAILGITLVLFVFVLNQYTILMAIAIFEEFKLEQLDSELI
uniref:Transmembrane protein n=1 Tax=Ulva sp. TM708 TaxID=2496873 RepID=A0A7R6NFF3_9CHLO|nr:hypothetical protein JXX85_mgp21 [Ulva sp. TM708]AZP40133.1 hypothetical protein [Ulva sp. TM708]